MKIINQLNIVVIIFLVLISKVFALETGTEFIEGKVKSFTQSEVIIETDISVITIPRSYVYEKKLVSGKSIRVDFLKSDESKFKFSKKK